MPELVTIARYQNLPEAWIAKGKLEAAGVPCFLADENIVSMNWLWGHAIGGIRLQVSSDYVETANHILSDETVEDG
jgi:Putative prokaryotic signal transducing protein